MRFWATIIFLLTTLKFFGQEATIFGFITDENNKPVEIANITIPFTSIGTISDSKGYYELTVPANQDINISYTYVGYHTIDTVFNLKPDERKQVNISLTQDFNQIQEVIFSSKLNKGTNLTRIEIKDFGVLPNSSGNIETLLKTFSGVSANNELTSQYSVRGGNYDENLVYVNDVQIYRPFLIRSGQQEGLSFVNPDLVRSLDFSAGGFEAKYGDKMSSVLDIKYRVPKENRASVSVSLIGGSAHLEGTALKKRFTHISGFRYKTTRYLLNSLDIEGNYQPSFMDFQSYLTYEAVKKKLFFSFLGNISSNEYLLVPTTRETKFGTFNNAMNIRVYYEGQEIDNFNSLTGAFTTTYVPNQYTTIKLIASTFQTKESEKFDIIGYYLINQVDTRPDSDSYGDSLINLSAAGFHDHARNFLDAQVYSLQLKGLNEKENSKTEWGIQVQNEKVNDELNEWDFIDSAGYSVPYREYQVSMFNRTLSYNVLNTLRYNAYFQKTRIYEKNKDEWYLTYGIRGSYWDFNNQTIVSPRISLAYIPSGLRNFSFFTSTGYYYQPPFYKELRDKNGELNQYLLAQKSVHFILGSDYVFSAWNRPFKLTSELYYKFLDNLIPYKIDNVRIQYNAKNISHGYATGIEFKLSGEFVPDAQSWASLSFMTTKEDIEGDYYYKDGVRKYVGSIYRPTNQFMNFSMFFQDYFPTNPEYKFHLTFFYGSRIPFSNPQVKRYDILYKMRAYKRIDAGFSKSITRLMNQGVFQSVWVNLEILNLFGFENVSSYSWIRTVSNLNSVPGQYAVPNFLTGRRVNAKVTLKFKSN